MALPSITCIAIDRTVIVSKSWPFAFRLSTTYFPLFARRMPKLEPTTPVQVQFSSAAFVHLAVAVAPTFRHVIDAYAGEAARTARATVEGTIMFAVDLGSADGFL